MLDTNIGFYFAIAVGFSYYQELAKLTINNPSSHWMVDLGGETDF